MREHGKTDERFARSQLLSFLQSIQDGTVGDETAERRQNSQRKEEKEEAFDDAMQAEIDAANDEAFHRIWDDMKRENEDSTVDEE